MKIMICLVALGLWSSVAVADDAAKQAAAQKQIDDAKVKGCEVIKATLAKSKSCPDQGAAAAKVTCSPATYAEITQLNDACAQILKDAGNAAAAKASASSSKPSTAGKTVTCAATTLDGAPLGEATGASSSACRTQLTQTLTASACDGSAKLVKYLYRKDAGKPTKAYLACKKAK